MKRNPHDSQSQSEAHEAGPGANNILEHSSGMPQCPEAFLTPREITGYIRQLEEGSELPPAIEAHIDSCSACIKNWEFIERTDPVLRKLRGITRVPLVVQSVLAEEVFISEPVPSGAKLPQAESKRLVDGIKRGLAQRGSHATKGPELEWASKIGSENLTAEDILKMCETVQQIENEDQRYSSARRLAQLFELRLRKAIMENKVTQDQLFSMNQEGSSADAPPEMVAVFLASFPHTSFYPESGLLDRAVNRIRFNPNRNIELRTKFERYKPKRLSGPLHRP